MLCGAFRFAQGTPPALLSVLPGVIVLRGPEIARDDLLRSTLRALSAELENAGVAPGSAVLVDHLTDILFIGILRRYLAEHGDECVGWLRALRDEGLGRAMAAMHERPEAEWTVPELARVAGMSRATFARRFDELVGTTPAAFLQGLRVDVARRLLTHTDKSVAEVAAAVGYASEFSFSRTFKKHSGLAPSFFRERAQEATAILA